MEFCKTWTGNSRVLRRLRDNESERRKSSMNSRSEVESDDDPDPNALAAEGVYAAAKMREIVQMNARIPWEIHPFVIVSGPGAGLERA